MFIGRWNELCLAPVVNSTDSINIAYISCNNSAEAIIQNEKYITKNNKIKDEKWKDPILWTCKCIIYMIFFKNLCQT